MSDPIKQHDLPATYLRRFAIDPGNNKLKRMVWCMRKAYNKILLEDKSVYSTLFITRNFYTIDHPEDPYAVEKFFSKEIEPRYELIMTELLQEKNLSLECRANLILWLHFNKIRNQGKRAHLQKMIDVSAMVDFVPKFGLKEFNKVRPEMIPVMEQRAKQVQINAFADQDLLNKFDKGIASKHWLILKSNPDNPFITNDDPGFSIAINENEADFTTLSGSFSTHVDATNYFILSPQYCLVISPFYQGTPIEVNAGNQEIEFLKSGKTHIDFINFCTVQTRNKYIISNSQNALQRIQQLFTGG